MRMRQNSIVGKAAILRADAVEQLVVETVGNGCAVGEQRGEFAAIGGRVAASRFEQRCNVRIETEIARTDELILAHRQSTGELRQRFAGADGEDQPGCGIALSSTPCLEDAECLDCGLDPRIAVRQTLLRIQRRGRDAFGHHNSGCRSIILCPRQRFAHACATVPASISAAIAPLARPSRSASTISLCWPKRGAGCASPRSSWGTLAKAPAAG